MPKDEFDLNDPMELNGVGLVSFEDTTEAMTECFVEEFMRLGYNHKQILALFRNPHYIGMNMALQNRGESFVREVIVEVFARWGREIAWAAPGISAQVRQSAAADEERLPGDELKGDRGLCDPMGAPIPDLDI